MIHGRGGSCGTKARADGDLDDFKRVNDTFGHAAGDQLLIEAARRLREVVRDSDTVARLGGDEFAIVLPKLSSPAAAEDIAARLVKALALPFAVEGQVVRVSVSVGVALYPLHTRDLDALKRLADAALYAVKHRGRNGYQLGTSS